jgi:hypothetical protein
MIAPEGAGMRAKHSDIAALYSKRPPPLEDSVEQCRENARFDSKEAQRMTTAFARSKYQNSAASWTERANILQRLRDVPGARPASAPQIAPLAR